MRRVESPKSVSRTGERHRRRRRECVCDLPLASRFERSLPSVRARVARFQGARSPGTFRSEPKKCGDRAVRKDMFATGNRAPQGTRRAEASGARAHLLWQTLPSTLSELRAGDATRACARAEVSPFLLFARLRLRNDAFSPELGPLAFRSVGQPEKTRPSAGTSTSIRKDEAVSWNKYKYRSENSRQI